MPLTTRYHSMSDEDLLRALVDKRQYSELVEELCQRLEENSTKECPVCGADIATATEGLQ